MRSMKGIRGLEALSHEEQLRKLSLLSPVNRSLQGDPTGAFKYLKETLKKAGEGHFTRACSDRTRGVP